MRHALAAGAASGATTAPPRRCPLVACRRSTPILRRPGVRPTRRPLRASSGDSPADHHHQHRSSTPTRTAELEPTSSSSSSLSDDDGSDSPSAAANRERIAQYNAEMSARMGWRDPYQYHPELGLYHHEVAPGVIVGTQPRGRREVDRLIDETRAGAILCLQEDRDAEHWGVDLERVKLHAEQRLGQGRHLRAPARDFDGDSLRLVLPRAAAMLEREIQAGRRVYVHCTAGLGRAPAVAIAWRYWFYDGDEAEEEGATTTTLDACYDSVTSVRPCGPRRGSIRGATVDLLTGAPRGVAVDLATLPPDAGAALTRSERAVVRRAAMAALLREEGGV
jgi:hypothetical protein